MQKGVPSGTPLAGHPAVICLLAEFREQRVVVRADGFALREVVLHADALHVDRDLRLIVGIFTPYYGVGIRCMA